MAILVSGSLAFDSISTFPGRFAEQILPQQLHILNVSFLVPTLRREFGGCAGNIAYTLAQLGARPVITAAVGRDGAAYLEHLRALGVDVDHVRIDDDAHTAQAFIITDRDNNQITAFHPGAMMVAHGAPWPTQPLALGLVGPDGPEAMVLRARQLADAKIPFVFDPGQGLPMFDGAALQSFVAQATWVAVNDYEAKMLGERLGTTMDALSRLPNLRGVIVTLGADGCEILEAGRSQRIGGETATTIVDPTGCGDAFRAGLLHGIEQGWSLERACRLGNRLGALKIAHRGGQSHRVPADAAFRQG